LEFERAIFFRPIALLDGGAPVSFSAAVEDALPGHNASSTEPVYCPIFSLQFTPSLLFAVSHLFPFGCWLQTSFVFLLLIALHWLLSYIFCHLLQFLPSSHQSCTFSKLLTGFTLLLARATAKTSKKARQFLCVRQLQMASPLDPWSC
jgi:hypothetical protein